MNLDFQVIKYPEQRENKNKCNPEVDENKANQVT